MHKGEDGNNIFYKPIEPKKFRLGKKSQYGVLFVAIILIASTVVATVRLGNDGVDDWSMIDSDLIRCISSGKSYPATGAGFQSAYDDANATGYGDIKLPSGTIAVTIEIKILITDSLSISGSGNTILQATAPFTGDAVLEIGDTTHRPHDLRLYNFEIDSNDLCDYGLKIRNLDSGSHISYLRIANFNKSGLYIGCESSTNQYTHETTFERLTINGGNNTECTGIEIADDGGGTAAVAHMSFRDVVVNHCPKYGVWIKDGIYITFEKCIVTCNGATLDAGFMINTTFATAVRAGLHFVDCNVENHCTGALNPTGAAFHVYVDSGDIQGLAFEGVTYSARNATDSTYDYKQIINLSTDGTENIRETTIRNMLYAESTDNAVRVNDSNVFATRIYGEGFAYTKMEDIVYDGGTYTVLNGYGEDALSGGNPSTNYMVGDIIRDTDTDNVWIMTTAPGWIQLD